MKKQYKQMKIKMSVILSVLLAFLVVRINIFYDFLPVSKSFKIFVDLMIASFGAFFIKKFLYRFASFAKIRSLSNLNESPFLKRLANISAASFFIATLYYYVIKESNIDFLAHLRVFGIIILVFAIFWTIFFTKNRIREKSDEFFKRVGIERGDANFKKVSVALQKIAMLALLKITIEVMSHSKYFLKYLSFLLKNIYLIRISNFLLAFLTVMLFRKIVDTFLNSFSTALAESTNDFGKNFIFIVPLISNTFKIMFYILYLISFINLFGYTASGFVSSLPAIIQSIGIFGVGISLMAKDTISNFLAGIFIVTDTPFVIGDRIKIDGIYGDVETIGIRTTKIKTRENTIITVPNSRFTENAVTSYRQGTGRIKVFHELPVSHTMDVELAKDIIYNILTDCSEVLNVPNPKVYFISYDRHHINLRLIFWIRDITKEGPALDLINSAMRKEFKKRGFPLPYPFYEVAEKGKLY